MTTKFLSLLAGAALLGGVSVAGAAEPLSSDQMDAVVAGHFFNAAAASASAVALGPRTVAATSADTIAVIGFGSAASSQSLSVAC